jgi:hypothetical protein
MHLDLNSLSLVSQLVYQLTELADREDSDYESDGTRHYGYSDASDDYAQARTKPGGFPYRRRGGGGGRSSKVDLEP